MSAGWIVSEECRAALLARFPPRYAHAVAHHVTLPGQGDDDPLPEAARFTIVGRSDDGEGVEAIVVTKDGDTNRTDGGTWHITWSLEEGRSAKQSNDAIATFGWEQIEAIAVETQPSRWN